jgi:HPt (histidine-containing phosphotransfer) domain-containing protein
MRSELHKFKGGLGYCGVPALQKVVADLYKQIQVTPDIKQLEPNLKQMFLEIDKVISAYRTYIAKS